MNTRRRRSLAVRLGVEGLLLLAILAGGDAARGGTGGTVVLPTGNRRPSGLRLEIDTRWVDGSGYRPVTVRIRPAAAGPAVADRRVRIVISPYSWQGGSSASVACTIELSQGSLSSERTVAVPSNSGWSAVRVETYEDGRRLRDLSADYLGWSTRAYYEWTEASPSILIITSDAPSKSGRAPTGPPTGNAQAGTLPDFRELAGQVPLNYVTGLLDATAFQTSQPMGDAGLLRLLRDLPRQEVLPPSDLPEDWIAWTSLDVVIVSWDDLRLLQRTFPAKWRALRSWVATGPTLCVFGVAPEPGQLAQLESEVGAVPLVDGLEAWRGWSAPTAETYGKPFYDPAEYGSTGRAVWRGAAPAEPGAPAGVSGQSAPSGPPPFLMRPLQQGQLVVLTEDSPFPGTAAGWNWLLTSLGSTNVMWYRRHGFSQQRENPEFWNWLIPGVGRAPVSGFVLFISLFVITIGPLNYWWLWRHRRLYLLLATVPAGAACVTGGLFLYALTTDGVRVRTRVRSFCEVDQRTGRAVSWSRQTYYAGLAPRGGLQFPRDAAVYPLEFRPQRGIRRSSRLLDWDAEQHLADGYLASRTTAQFVVVESRTSDVGLDFSGLTDATSLPRVGNRLGADLLRVVVRSAEGRFWSASDVAFGASKGLVEAVPADEARVWNQALLPLAPRYPDGFNPLQIENASEFFWGYDYWRSTADDRLPPPTLRRSLLERRWQEALADNFARLPRRGYLALVAQPVETSLGVRNVRLEASTHVVLGRW